MNDTEYILSNLPKVIPSPLIPLCNNYLTLYSDISEIRLRKNAYISFTKGNENITTAFVCDDDLFSKCAELIIGNSFYKKRSHIINGIIPLPCGFRAGVCGSALPNTDGNIDNIYDISSFNIRFPRSVSGCSDKLIRKLLELPHQKSGLLILSPPGGGKTTFLRDIALRLSTPPVSERVCVVDENFELAPLSIPQNAQIDILKGYSIDKGIIIATRFLNPRYIICDEIGSDSDINAIKNATHSGVPFIASAHASSVEEFISKPDISQLMYDGVFNIVVELVNNNNDIVPNIKCVDISSKQVRRCILG